MVANSPLIANQKGIDSQEILQAQERQAPPLPHHDRRQFFEKGAVVLNQGVRDSSTDFGRDAILDPSRIGRPQMMAMVATVFPEVATSQSSQRGAFMRAFENPALIRSYLINPQETAYFLIQRFPEMQDVIVRNMPFQKVENHLEPNKYSALYGHITEEVGRGVRAHESRVRREMDKLLSSFVPASIGGSAGMETKAYELLRNRIESPGFNKDAARMEYRIAKLMTSPQARQDLREAQGLAGLGALPPTVQQSVVQPQPSQPQVPSPTSPEPKTATPNSMGGSEKSVDPKPIAVPAATPIPPSIVVPNVVTPAPAINQGNSVGGAIAAVGAAEGVGASRATPIPVTPPTPAPPPPNQVSDRERALEERVAQLEAQLRNATQKPVAPPTQENPTPSADVEQLRQESKQLKERLTQIEESLKKLANEKNGLEKENSQLKTKVVELEKRNEELKKSRSQEAPIDQKERTPVSVKPEPPQSAPKEKGAAPLIQPVSPAQPPQVKVTEPKENPKARVSQSNPLNELVGLLNTKGDGEVEAFLMDNYKDLMTRTDEEVLGACRRVKPDRLSHFAGTLRSTHRGMASGKIKMDFATPADITRLGEVAALATKVSEETH